MIPLLRHELGRLVVAGTFTVFWPDGSETLYRGRLPGPDLALRIADSATARRLLFNPALAFGEAYVDGGVIPVGCTLYDLLDAFFLNRAGGGSMWSLRLHARWAMALRRLAQHNPARRARRNAAHHYDLNGRLYGLFLDRDRQYSCALFPTGGETLDEAQALKKQHFARKLYLHRPDLHVLDIGCGWGGLAMTLARDYGARVTGITLSQEQLQEARARAAAAGLGDRVRFELLDYRAVQGQFDRIVSVGMFEHVGINHYRQFFTTLYRCLAPDGVALVHTIGRASGPGATNPWIGRYIFPGGYSPALSEIMPAIEASGLIHTDVEVLRLHYAETLAHWRRRFAANRDAIAAITDARFCRMFEFYLAGSELAFRRGGHVNFQIQLARQQTTLPLTRDYLYADARTFEQPPQSTDPGDAGRGGTRLD